ncbi:MAG TPA: alpha/beta hydrolase-fold protein, partial [Planctomycetota bacterium]|nr:alpha/beta hydrolase-fold protein [Planctomycetota bacterium]
DVEVHSHTSRLLAGNRAGDPATRALPIYVPHAARDGARLPVVFLLVGFTGDGREFLEAHPWRRGVVLEYDAALRAGMIAPAVLVLPNCFTKYGGSQYVDSSFNGPYASHVALELAAFVDEHVPTLRGARGVVGKSSGGVGALHLAMRHPGVFRAVASISGDAGFEGCHAPAFWDCARALVPFGGDPARFLAEFLAKPDLSGERFGAINTIAMAACYSPNVASAIGCDLPLDPRTGERVEAVWRRWLEFDPIEACERYAANLRALALLHIEAGSRDEYNIQFGTRRLSQRFTELGIPHTSLEHDGGHRGIQSRWLALLPRVIAAL